MCHIRSMLKAILTLSLVAVTLSSCGEKVKTRPWAESFGTSVEFSFEDMDLDSGELQGNVILRGVQSPTAYSSYQVYWASSSKNTDKIEALGSKKFVDFASNPLLKIPANSPIVGPYLLLYIVDDKNTQQYTGKYIRIKDKAKKPQSNQAPPTAQKAPAMAKPEFTFDPAQSRVQFDFDQSSIGEEARNLIEQVFTTDKDINTLKLVVVGHCDDQGSNAYNLALGQRRAQSVKNYLVRVMGMPRRHIRTLSCGEEQPLQGGQSGSDRAANRRAVTLLNDTGSYDCAALAQY